jgi:DNA repair exonuclease SbcCD ATPase subunit
MNGKLGKKQTAPALPDLDAQQEHALAQRGVSLAEREQALAEREQALTEREKQLDKCKEKQDDRELRLKHIQELVSASTADLEEKQRAHKERREIIDAQKKIQDEMLELLEEWEVNSIQRSGELDERERRLQITTGEYEARVDTMEQALNAAQEELKRLKVVISECAGYEERAQEREERAQACAELAHLRGVGLEALEAAELRKLQGVVQKTSRLLEHALVRRAAESEVFAAQIEFMCPIGHDLMQEPVMAADGHTYERRHIERLFAMKAGETLRSPMTNAELTKTDLYPNHALKSMIERAVDAKVAEINAR